MDVSKAHPLTPPSRQEVFESIELAESTLSKDDIVFFVTWNPSPQKRYYSDSLLYDHKWDSMLTRVLLKLKHCCSKYCILPEITTNGRLHCHGWIVIDDLIKWKKSMVGTFKKEGFLKIDKQRYQKSGLDYYKKSIHETYNLLNPIWLVISHTREHELGKIILGYKIAVAILESEKTGLVNRGNIFKYFPNPEFFDNTLQDIGDIEI